MKALLLIFLSFIIIKTSSANQYVTPGTGVKYTLDDLVTNSSGRVTFSTGVYFINDTISVNKNDTLIMYNDATVKFMLNTYLGVRENGVLLINPPNNITFTANNITDGYLGVKLDTTSASVIRKLTLEYAVSFRINDCNPTLDSCIFRYNNNLASTSFGNGAVALFRASPVIKNCSFINNKRAAIQGGSNINNAPKIYNNYFFANSTTNANVPQINLGATSASGQDTVKIIGNYIYGGYIMSGGIGFLPTGNVYALITNNTIRKNRYGITFNGGANINAMISYNVIDTNNIQNDPNLGGSGIAFSGGTAASQQNSIVTGNIIRANLWGVTIQNRSRPNLGNISNADTSDNGKNQFINNTNGTTPLIDLYNNTVDNIMAENNYWYTNDPAVAEQRIFHQADNGSLGLVDYDPIATAETLPVTLVSFEAVLHNKKTRLVWQTSTEDNVAHYNIQRSIDGKNFVTIGKQKAAGNTTSLTDYEYVDPADEMQAGIYYYRLQVMDKDGKMMYSGIRKVSLNNGVRFTIAPNPAVNNISLSGEGKVSINIITMAGQVVMNKRAALPLVNLNIAHLPEGMYIIEVTDTAGNSSRKRFLKQ